MFCTAVALGFKYYFLQQTVQYSYGNVFVAKLASRLFYCWSLLRNNNIATNLQVLKLR